MTWRAVPLLTVALGAAPFGPLGAEPSPRVDLTAQLTDRFAQCWNIGALSGPARETAVTVGVELTADARVDVTTIHLIRASTAPDDAIAQAYEAARRAVIRCGGAGLGLPPERREEWRVLELTFDPRDRLM